VGLTGVIFAVIAALWLVYLVPYFLHQRGRGPEDEVDIPFTPGAVTIVRSGTDLAHAEEGVAEVSTPLPRRAGLRELKLRDELAAQRRRRVLIFLLAVQFVVALLAGFGIGAWWGALIPAGLLLAFVVVARFSVRAMRADLARRAEQLRSGFDEETVAIALDEVAVAAHEHSVELSVPLGRIGSLWEPIPITRPTYVSTPLAPRTVRTIDLAAPVMAATPAAVPVLAASPDDSAEETDAEVG
jgi:hypothetical protein